MISETQFPRSTPEEQGIASAGIRGFLEAFEKETAGKDNMEMHSFMLVRHGYVTAEGWWSPNAPCYRHMLYSLSKSFTSTAVGFAAAEGLLSVDDPVISFFPEDLPAEVGQNLAAMRIKHLLTMSTGHAEDTLEPMVEQAGNWARTFLSLPVKYAPGTHFLYNTGASYMLSAIVQKVTGSRVVDYLQPRLFEPLGIKDAVWDNCPRGINIGGYGLSIKTEDIAKFGQLYLQKGLWNGKRILPESWVEEATRKHMSNGSALETDSDWEQGYGYQFWMCRHGAYRGDGAYGQYCFIMPEQDAVIAITSAVANMGLMFGLVWKHLLPAMHEGRLPENRADHETLLGKLASLKLPVPQGISDSAISSSASGRLYAVEKNSLGMDKISFNFEKSGCLVKIYGNGRKYSLKCGIGNWMEDKASEAAIAVQYDSITTVFTAGTWTDENTFKIVVRLVESPHYNTITCHFDGENLKMDFTTNLTMFPYEVPPIAGKLEK